MYYSCYDKEDEYHDKIKQYRYNQTIQGLFIYMNSISFKIFYDIFRYTYLCKYYFFLNSSV